MRKLRATIGKKENKNKLKEKHNKRTGKKKNKSQKEDINIGRQKSM
jgi:hypothetical protein